MTTNFKTPTAAARGLGSAKSGTGHHIKQRVSAIALVVLIPWFLYAVIAASRGGYEGATAWLAMERHSHDPDTRRGVLSHAAWYAGRH